MTGYVSKCHILETSVKTRL